MIWQIFFPDTGNERRNCQHAFCNPGKYPADVHALHSIDWNENAAEYDTKNSTGGSQQHQKFHGSGTSIEGVEQVVYYIESDKR